MSDDIIDRLFALSRNEHGDPIDAAISEIERLREELAKLHEAVDLQLHTDYRSKELKTQLAAAHERETRLREALAEFLRNPGGDYTEEIAEKALALPHDDTALRERLKTERERIAEYVDRNLMSAREYAEAIRNMEDE